MTPSPAAPSSLPKSLYQLTADDPQHAVNWASPSNYRVHLDFTKHEEYAETSQVIIFKVIRLPKAGEPCYINSYNLTKDIEFTFDGNRIAHQSAKDSENTDYNFSVIQFCLPQSKLDAFKVNDTFEVSIKSKSKLCEDLHGIYYSNYVTKEGEKKRLISTQFEPAYARRAFLCVDEPRSKATYDLTYTVNGNFQVVANTKLLRQEKSENDTLTYTFTTTPILSAYLIGFAIGEITCKVPKLQHLLPNIDIEVCSYTGTDEVLYEKPLELAVEHLITQIRSFGPFPIDKVSHVALTEFRAGAMENNGVITYRDSSFLVHKNSSLFAKSYQTQVIAHELAHHWFGNLVTMKWWDNLWLNESFATAVQFYTINETHKRLGDVEQFAPYYYFSQSIITKAMYLDSKLSSHPIKATIHKIEDIDTIFDVISYFKGATILLQLINYLSPENFFAAIRSYLAKHKNANADDADLWSDIQKSIQDVDVPNKDIPQLMKSWIELLGFPCVSYKLNGSSIEIEQNQYLSICRSQSQNQWCVPIKIECELVSSSDPNSAPESFNKHFILSEKSSKVDLPPNKTIKSLKIDGNASTFSIFNLDDKLLDIFLSESNIKKLDDIDTFSCFRSLTFLLESVKFEGCKPVANFPSITIGKILNYIKGFNLDKNKYYGAHHGVLYFLEHVFSIACYIEDNEISSHSNLVDKIRSKLLAFIAEYLPAFDINFIDNQKFIEYEFYESYAKLLFELRDQKTIDIYLQKLKDSELNNTPLDLRILTLAYASKVINVTNISDFQQILSQIKTETDSNRRVLKYIGILTAIPNQFVKSFVDFCFSDDLKQTDLYLILKKVKNISLSEEFAKCIVDRVDDLAKKNNSLRIAYISFLQSCSTQRALDTIAKLRASKTENGESLTVERIFDEAQEFVESHKYFAHVCQADVEKLL